jgi:hypothetical protein
LSIFEFGSLDRWVSDSGPRSVYNLINDVLRLEAIRHGTTAGRDRVLTLPRNWFVWRPILRAAFSITLGIAVIRIAMGDGIASVARFALMLFPLGILIGLVLWRFGGWLGDERELAALRARPWRVRLLDPSAAPSVAWGAFAGGYVFLVGGLVGFVVERGVTWDIAGVVLFGAAGVCLGQAAFNATRPRLAVSLRLAGIGLFVAALASIVVSMF